MSETPTDVLVRAMAEANAAGMMGMFLGDGWVRQRINELQLAQVEDTLETVAFLLGEES